MRSNDEEEIKQKVNITAKKWQHSYLRLITFGNEIVCCLSNLVMHKIEAPFFVPFNESITDRSCQPISKPKPPNRLLAESLGVPVQEQQLAPPPSPNPDDFGASFGEDDGGEAAPPAQATANSRTGGIAGSLGAAAMQPPPR